MFNKHVIQRRFCLNVERPEGSHYLTQADFDLITSFFEEPEAHEGLRVDWHAAPGPAADTA